jgi:hypothetical protein
MTGQWWSWVVLFLLVFTVAALLDPAKVGGRRKRKSSSRRRRKRAPGGVYLFRTRKPGAFYGWSLRWALVGMTAVGALLYALGGWWWLAPLCLLMSGRHSAYVGQTSNYARRLKQHLEGDVRWGAKPKDWNDLEPRFYRLPTLFPRHEIARLIQEWVYVQILLPAYNVKLQPPWNARRIRPSTAAHQRALRGRLGLWYRIPRAVFRYGLVIAIFAGSVWLTPGGWW